MNITIKIRRFLIGLAIVWFLVFIYFFRSLAKETKNEVTSIQLDRIGKSLKYIMMIVKYEILEDFCLMNFKLFRYLYKKVQL